MARNYVEKNITKCLGELGDQGADKMEIFRLLGVKPKERAAVMRILQEMLGSDLLVMGKKGKFKLKGAPAAKSASSTVATKSKGLLVGKIRIHASGGAWVYVDREEPANVKTGLPLEGFDRIRIGARSLNTALDGDTVLVKWLNPPRTADAPNKDKLHAKRKQPKKPAAYDEPTGVVEKIVERRKGAVIGTLRRFRGQWFAETDDINMPGQIQIRDAGTAKEGQKVAVKIVNWDPRFPDPLGEISEVLGWPDDPGVDILGIIEKHGLRVVFSSEVLEESNAVSETIPEEEYARRIDWRDKMVITIDPKDAKDHDDAVWVSRVKDGWKLAVHIADVSHYVKPRSAMDKEAFQRGNSTYLVDRVLPMLPEKLSNGICSLRPNEDRLTKCAVMHFSADGKMISTSFEDAVICSPAKLSYEQAQEMLVGNDKSELAKLVKESWQLAKMLRDLRFKNGALDLDFPEVRVKLDDKKKPIEVVKSAHFETHQLIEEFMLVANEAVAKAIRNAGKPAVYRIHEDPDIDRLNDFAEMATQHGYKPGDLSNKKHIQSLLDKAKGTPEEHAIKLGLLKSLNRAAYSPEPLGHYGLSKENYCHFTSPIRRYADLIVHRALQPLLKNPPKEIDKTPNFAKTFEISKHISTTERTSAEAENETHKMKMLEYLEMLMQDDDAKPMNAIITEIRPSGLFVEATDLLMKGMVKREDLGGARWWYEANPPRFISGKNKEVRLGQNIQVLVKKVDRDRGLVDFALP